MILYHIMHITTGGILRWLKVRTIQFLLEILITCQNSEMAHFFKFENSEMAQNTNHFCLEFNFSSNSEPSQNFRTKKSEPSQNFDT